MSSWSSPSLAFAVDGCFGEHALQAVVVRLEDANNPPNLVAIGLIARIAEADVTECFFDLALCEGFAAREFLAQ